MSGMKQRINEFDDAVVTGASREMGAIPNKLNSVDLSLDLDTKFPKLPLTTKIMI